MTLEDASKCGKSHGYYPFASSVRYTGNFFTNYNIYNIGPLNTIGRAKIQIESDTKITTKITSWCFFPTHLKNIIVKLDHLPQGLGWTKKYLKPPPTLGPQNHEKWRFSTPNIWFITPKNEGTNCWNQLLEPTAQSVKIQLPDSEYHWQRLSSINHRPVNEMCGPLTRNGYIILKRWWTLRVGWCFKSVMILELVE